MAWPCILVRKWQVHWLSTPQPWQTQHLEKQTIQANTSYCWSKHSWVQYVAWNPQTATANQRCVWWCNIWWYKHTSSGTVTSSCTSTIIQHSRWPLCPVVSFRVSMSRWIPTDLTRWNHEAKRRGDSTFAELLCRVRTNDCTPEDLDIVQRIWYREISDYWNTQEISVTFRIDILCYYCNNLITWVWMTL